MVKPGSVVLRMEDDYKRRNFPLRIITNTTINDLGEVTQVLVKKKGKTEHVDKLYISKTIPLFVSNENFSTPSYDKFVALRPKCKAAKFSEEKIKNLFRKTAQNFLDVFHKQL